MKRLYMWAKISNNEELEDGGVVVASSEELAFECLLTTFGYNRSENIIVIKELTTDTDEPFSIIEFVKEETKYWGGRTPNDYRR